MNCQIHPFKQCSFYSKKLDRLQCPLCLLPSDLQQQVIDNTTKPLQNNSIIDIDLVESLAQSLIQEEDMHQDLNQLEQKYLDIITEFKKNTISFLEQLCQNIQSVLLQNLYKLRMKAEQHQTEMEENQKLLQKIQEMRKKDDFDCIESITSLQSAIIKSDKINHQKILSLQTNTIQILEEFAKQFMKTLASIDVQQFENDIQLIFDPKSKPVNKQHEIKSVNQSMSSQLGNISVEQIKKITIQNQFQSQYVVNSILSSESQVIIGTKCGKLVLYECNSFDELFSLDAHKDSVKILAKGLNEKLFVSSSQDKVLKIWEKFYSETDRAFQITLKFDLEQQVSQALCLTVCEGISVSKSKIINLLLVGSADNTVRVWNYDNGQYFFTYSGHTGDVYSVAFVKKINLIASGSQDKSIRLWDGINYKYSRPIFKFSGHTDSVTGILAISEENQILSCGLDKTFRQWDCDKKVQVRVFTIQFLPQRLIQFQSGIVLIQSSDTKVRIYDYRITTLLHEINNQRRNVATYCVDYDNKSILCVSENHINLFY
ncbi:unnamed protein product [Paramecium octaurelia]|uniref:WD domain, G-beta repeat protein n=1 Tax=Paramecium octaurelia TaxID=43137 RepID=A0A8S1TRB9_PAROT|nr:unnamed protein product [Paramecium octaurelia]